MPWDYDQAVEIAGLKLEGGDLPIVGYPTGRETVPVLEPHTLMIWRVVKHNWEKRPIYFAVTVPDINMAGLKSYLSMEGMAYKLVRTRGYEQFEEEKIRRNLLEVYRYTGVADSTVHKDPVARRLLSNYLILFDGLVRAYIRLGMHQEAYEVLVGVEKRVPPYALDFPETWQLVGAHYHALAIHFYESGDITRAVSSLENLLRLGPPLENPEDIRRLIDRWKQGTPPREADSVGSVVR